MDYPQPSELFRKGRYQQCLSLINAAPTDTQNLWLEGACLTRLHQYEAGLEKFAESWNAQKDSQSGLSYVRALASLGYVKEAEELNREIVNRWPNLDLEVCRAAFSEFKNGNHASVLPLLMSGWQNNRSSPFLFITIDFFQRLLGDQSYSNIPVEYRRHNQLSPYVDAFNLCFDAYQTGAQLLAYPVEPLLVGIEQRPTRGWVAEFGVFWGRSINLIAERCDQHVYGFDSFAGLPEDWKDGENRGAYSTEGVIPTVADNVRLFKGWFKDTIPQFLSEQTEPASFIHIDCDLYSSTRDVLNLIKPQLQVGTIIVFDDYLGFPDYQKHEKKAFEEFSEKHHIEYDILGVALLSRELAVKITAVG